MDVEARVLRKISWRIVPFLMLLYFVAFVDRVNIGVAALTMNRDLHFSPQMFGLGAGIFFIGYFLLEVPSNLILHRVGARIWIARIMITWGVLSAGTAFITGPLSFYTLRFLLGVAEAGFFPGIILYLSLWFPARRRAAMTAVFMAAAPLSTALGSPLSGLLLGMHGVAGLAGWQWMFLAEALPAIALGIVVLFALTDRPAEAKWLAQDERTWLVAAMAKEQVGHRPVGLWQALSDRRIVILALAYFGTSAGLYTVGLWGPQIIAQLGFSNLMVSLLNAVPGALAVGAMIWWSWHSDRSGERIWHTIIPCLIGAAAFCCAGIATGLVAVLAALTLATFGANASKPPLWSLPTLYLGGPAAAAAIGGINAVGNIGGFAGPYVIGWLKQATGSFAGGLYFVAATMVLSAALILALPRLAPAPERP